MIRETLYKLFQVVIDVLCGVGMWILGEKVLVDVFQLNYKILEYVWLVLLSAVIYFAEWRLKFFKAAIERRGFVGIGHVIVYTIVGKGMMAMWSDWGYFSLMLITLTAVSLSFFGEFVGVYLRFNKSEDEEDEEE